MKHVSTTLSFCCPVCGKQATRYGSAEFVPAKRRSDGRGPLVSIQLACPNDDLFHGCVPLTIPQTGPFVERTIGDERNQWDSGLPHDLRPRLFDFN